MMGNIISLEDWESTVKPGWTITMWMQPMHKVLNLREAPTFSPGTIQPQQDIEKRQNQGPISEAVQIANRQRERQHSQTSRPSDPEMEAQMKQQTTQDATNTGLYVFRNEDSARSREGAFSTQEDRDRQERTHAVVVTCSHTECDRVFDNMDVMRDHVRRIHSQKADTESVPLGVVSQTLGVKNQQLYSRPSQTNKGAPGDSAAVGASDLLISKIDTDIDTDINDTRPRRDRITLRPDMFEFMPSD